METRSIGVLGMGPGKAREVARTLITTEDLPVADRFAYFRLAHELETDNALPPESHRQVLLHRIQVFVQKRLGDPALSPGMIAAAHHISSRSLHRLFHTHGSTVAGWIRARRLERCRHDLTDPFLRTRPVHAIAAQWGFTDAAHFSRTFKATYGLTPQAYRHSVVRQAGDSGVSDGTV